MARSTASSSTRARSSPNSAGSRSGTSIVAWRLPGSGTPRPEVVGADQVTREAVAQGLELLVHVPPHDALVRVTNKCTPGRELAVQVAHARRRVRALHRREAFGAAQAQ